MSIKRILLPINGHDDVGAVADLAFALAGKVGAEIEILHPHVAYYDAITSVSEGGSAEQVMRDIQRERDRFERENVAAEQRYTALSEKYPGITTTFVEMSGRTSNIVADRAFSCDLVAIGNANAFDTAFWRDVYDGALLHSARPSLIAPSDPSLEMMDRDNLAKDIVIAWNGSAESARAFSAALPFFATAQHVRLLTIGDNPASAASANRMKDFARLHGAQASVTVLNVEGQSVADTILQEARHKPGTLLAMGAYSHARWREKIFGGVTEYILHHTPVPVLMAH